MSFVKPSEKFRTLFQPLSSVKYQTGGTLLTMLNTSITYQFLSQRKAKVCRQNQSQPVAIGQVAYLKVSTTAYLKTGWVINFRLLKQRHFSQNLQSLELGFSQDFDSSASMLNTSRSLADTATHHNISCVNDLSLMSQIYLKYNDYLHNDRLKRLLNQWNRQEKLKVSLRFYSNWV